MQDQPKLESTRRAPDALSCVPFSARLSGPGRLSVSLRARGAWPTVSLSPDSLALTRSEERAVLIAVSSARPTTKFVVSVPALKSGPPQCTSVLLQFLMLLSVVSLPASRSGPPQGTTPRVTTLRTGNKLMSCDTDATDVGARARSLTSLASLAPPFLSLSPPENEPATW